jgi:hypothetical protein
VYFCVCVFPPYYLMIEATDIYDLALDCRRALHVPNTAIRRDPLTPTVKEEISHYISQYSARLSAHPNNQIMKLMAQLDNRRTRRHIANDLPTIFQV